MPLLSSCCNEKWEVPKTYDKKYGKKKENSSQQQRQRNKKKNMYYIHASHKQNIHTQTTFWVYPQNDNEAEENPGVERASSGDGVATSAEKGGKNKRNGKNISPLLKCSLPSNMLPVRPRHHRPYRPLARPQHKERERASKQEDAKRREREKKHKTGGRRVCIWWNIVMAFNTNDNRLENRDHTQTHT